VHFPKAITEYPFSGPGCYLIEGVVKEEFAFICIEVSAIKRLGNQSLDDIVNYDRQAVGQRITDRHFSK